MVEQLKVKQTDLAAAETFLRGITLRFKQTKGADAKKVK
jgi:hypothetical protein